MDTQLAATCLLYGLINVTFFFISPFYPQMAQDRGLSSLYIGVTFAALPATAIVSTLVMPWLLRRISKRALALISCGLESLSFMLFALSEPTTGLVFGAMGVASRVVSGAALAIVQVTGSC